MKKILIVAAMLMLAACTKQMLNSSDPNNLSPVNNLSFSSTGNTYYVDSTATGNDSNNGSSPSTPWRTLTKVNGFTFNPGDRILFKCGNSWTGTLHPRGSGTNGSPITVDKYGTGNNPVIHGPGTTSSAGFLLYNQSYWEINDLEVTNYHTGGGTLFRGILVTNTDTLTPINHIYVKNCFVHDVNSYGYAANPSAFSKVTGGIILYGYFNDLQVRNCHVTNCSVEGLRTVPYNSTPALSTNVVFASNLIENIYGDGIVMSSVTGGLIDSNVVKNSCTTNEYNFAGCWTYNSHGSIISHNEVYNIVGGMNDGEAFDADQYTDGDIYEYNYSHNNSGGFMLFMSTSKNIIVRYNVSVNDCVSGTRLLCYNPDNTNINTLYNNVFYISPSQNLTINRMIDGRIDGFAGTLKNNIIYCGPNVTVSTFCKGTGPYSPSGVFMNNCFYPSSITATNGPSGTVSGNINSNPSFVSGGSNSAGLSTALAYKLNSSSPCLNAGTPISGNGGVDYSNTTLYSGNPDMGAFQHTITNGAFSASDDAYVRDGSYASNNYGTSDSLWVKSDATSYNRKAYLKFGYAAVTPKKVQSATLNIYAFRVNSDPSRTISVYTTATETWAQGTIKWSNAPMDTTYVGKITVTGTGTYTLDVKNAINAQLATPDHNISFLFMNKAAASPSNDVQFYSKEAASHQPQLSVTY